MTYYWQYEIFSSFYMDFLEGWRNFYLILWGNLECSAWYVNLFCVGQMIDLIQNDSGITTLQMQSKNATCQPPTKGQAKMRNEVE